MGASYYSGTSPYNGQTGGAIGNDNQPIPQQLPALDVNTTGGEINHTLTIPEMPSHSHPIDVRIATSLTTAAGNDYWRGVQGGNTGNTGGGLSHNNMPQYYTLAFIMRVI
jgi:microcystin-dependent protein